MAHDDKKPSAQSPKGIFMEVSTSEKRIPKYCNSVLFGKLSDGGVIMTFVAKEKVGDQDDQREEHVVIERIFVDRKHALQISETLSRFANDE